MQLYGSTTSPYVRRFRILFTKQSINFDFKLLKIMETEDRKFLKTISPTLKIPVLSHDGNNIADSRVIFNYITTEVLEEKTSFQDNNFITIIDGINDSLIQLFLIEMSNPDILNNLTYNKINTERVALSLEHLNDHIQSFNGLEGYKEISLMCLIDWINFRNRLDLSPYPKLMAYFNQNKNDSDFISTDPR